MEAPDAYRTTLYDKVCVVDIETMPIEGHKEALEPFMENLKTRSKVDPLKVAEELKDKKEGYYSKAALSPVAGRVVCIVVKEMHLPAIGVSQALEPKIVVFANADERVMLDSFAKYAEAKQWWVTYNGRNFDFPFLTFRAAHHGINLKLPMYYKNTFDGHFDLAQFLFDISLMDNLDSTRKYIKLESWNRYFGLPTKSMDARDIPKAVAEGRLQEVVDYCIGDVENTAAIFMKYHNLFERSFRR